MISFVEGILEYAEIGTWIINVNGVGYEVMVPSSDVGDDELVGTKVRLYTYLNINENTGVSLFGFYNRSDLDLFKLLITVNGVGPKGAQTMIGSLGADVIRMAIAAEDNKTLSKASGIGPKTASRIVIDLKDKIGEFDGLAALVGQETATGSTEEVKGFKKDAIEALVALGYSKTEATNAVKKVTAEESKSVDSILSASLKYLY